MNIYKVSIITCDYDEFDAIVVIAADETAAHRVACDHTAGGNEPRRQLTFLRGEVELVGKSESQEEGVVLGSFNAG